MSVSRWFAKASRLPLLSGFSLIEVVVAIGVMSFGIVVVLAYLTALNRSAAHHDESVAAETLLVPVIAWVRAVPFSEFTRALWASPGALSAADADRADGRFYASRGGDLLNFPGQRATGDLSKAYFEVALIRNQRLSPAALDEEAAWLAFDVEVRWPSSASAHGGKQAIAPVRQYRQIFAGSRLR